MKSLYLHVKTYITDNFELKLYLSVAVWLIIIFSINYSLDFEDQYIDKIKGYWFRVAGHFAFQFIPYLVPVLLISYFSKNKIYRSKEFWIKVFVAFLFLAVYRALYFYRFFCSWIDMSGCFFLYKIAIKYARLILLLIPLLIFYSYDKKHLKSFYGLSLSFKSIKQYFPLLGIMSLLIIFACMFESIQNYYPLYLKSGGISFADKNEIPQWFALFIYESSYLFNFISIEFFFRGFLILSLYKLIGPHVVLPAICCYATIHFGKPFLEAFSSVFGGYFLSVLTLKTENIWGGIFIHAGIAGMMELFSYLI